MSEGTSIEWATHTFNPWIGCTKVSPGCLNCYAEVSTPARVLRKREQETWGRGAARQRTSEATWRNPVKWDREAQMPSAYQRPRVFPSLCDWLDDEVPIEWLADFLKLIHDTPHLDWLLLTKRPENWRPRLEAVFDWLLHNTKAGETGYLARMLTDWIDGQKAPANVWIGTSCEDQKRADERITELQKIPAEVCFLSVEPLLERVDLRLSRNGIRRVDWVIVGGESGPGARPCEQEWIADVVAQCKRAYVLVFVKQRGSNAVTTQTQFRLKQRHRKGGDPREWPRGLRVRELPRA